jgi:glycosyltransferase involved in cell wall biosynthesis
MILPSQYESWGLVVNDALHHGLPCVVSDAVGCAPDLIESGVTGEVFDAGSVSDLSHAIRLTLPLIGRQQVRNNCRKRASGYGIDKAAEGIAKAYLSAVAPSRRESVRKTSLSKTTEPDQRLREVLGKV